MCKAHRKVTHIKQQCICSLTVSLSSLFHDAERTLSTIAKFLVHLLEKGREKVVKGRGCGKKEEGRGGYGCAEMRIHEKLPQNATYFSLWGRLLGATALCHTF